ncbi:hypothetical protein VCSRO147_2047 [Vibrio cholerae]|nr:hypothetical protein DN42_1849 [Vibrio cholerae]GHW11837.1 hypothetical protein VCSRO192_2124 [Vibrio cholerae]GHW20575.1 hypothetical protein VCSRO150_0505 [Vibrio cholerae]GHX23716.1 hypothetical protein VCSRO107_1924 [Vibrio cholerae]GHY26453.1 hypothetical protein VCSRO164_2089 [Vibrio cholerae]
MPFSPTSQSALSIKYDDFTFLSDAEKQNAHFIGRFFMDTFLSLSLSTQRALDPL